MTLPETLGDFQMLPVCLSLRTASEHHEPLPVMADLASLIPDLNVEHDDPAIRLRP